MAEKRRTVYKTEGGAAVDIFSVRSNAAQPLERPRELPKERAGQQQKVRVKAKTAFAPLTVIGVAVVLVLLIMVVYGYVQLYEATSRVSELKAELASVQEDNLKLETQYEGNINLTMIEYKARKLGMKTPSANQVIYLNISGADKGEVVQVEEENIIVTAWNAVKDSFSGILSYFF